MTSSETPTSTGLRDLFLEVLAYAGQDAGRFRLIEVPGTPAENGRKAAFYHAGPLIDEDPDDILHGAELGRANEPETRKHHRIAAFTDIEWDQSVEEATLAALLRHEVRHAQQFDALGPQFFDLYDLADTVCRWKVGGLPRGAALYGMNPAEMDANTAAAAFLRDSRPDDVQRVLESQDGQLARSNTRPGPLNELPTKMVAFLFMLREVAEDSTRAPNGATFEDRLRNVSERAADTWAALCAA